MLFAHKGAALRPAPALQRAARGAAVRAMAAPEASLDLVLTALGSNSAALWLGAHPLARDCVSALAVTAAATAWVRIWTALASAGVTPSTVSRKMIHTGSAPLFVLCWPLFSAEPYAAFAASFIPLVQVARLYRAGAADASSGTEAGLVKAVSRSGDRGDELLAGPLLYTLVLLAATAFGFRSLPAAVAVCQMAVGDGVADIVGRRFGSVKWPFARAKSVQGSLAFAVSAFAACLLVTALFNACGYTDLTTADVALPLALISVACSLVELVPGVDDNLSVPTVGLLLSLLLLRPPL